MSHISRRTLALLSITPVLSLALAACGSPAINTNYTPEAQPTIGATASSTATKGATANASNSGKPKAGGHASTGSHTTANTGTSGSQTTAPSGSRTGSGGSHTTNPCGWQSGSPTIRVTPCTNLTSDQTVTINGRGFDPKKPVLAVECLAGATDQTECNLPRGISLLSHLPKTWHPNADGTVTINLRVQKEFYGYTCSTRTPCVVSIASTDQSEDPSAPIYFR